MVVHNLAAMIKKELDKQISQSEKYKYQTNISNLIQLLRANLARLLNKKKGFRSLIKKIIKAAKNKEHVRPNRLYARWDVYISKPVTLKFRVDGKRNHTVRKTNRGYLRKSS